MRYEWRPPKTFFCGYRVSQLFCQPMTSSLVKNSWNWNSWNFAIFTAKHLCQSLFLRCNFSKRETLAQWFSCEFHKILKNTFFTEHLWMSASVLQQLQALHFAIICSWQLSSSVESLIGKKIHPNIFIFYTDIFVFYFLWQKPVYLDGYTKCMLYSEQPIFLLARTHQSLHKNEVFH